MDLEQAYQALVQNYLTLRRIPQSKRKGIEELMIGVFQQNSGLIDGLRDILYDSVAKKSNYHGVDLEHHFADPETGRVHVDVKDMNAYIDAQVLDAIADQIRETPEEQRSENQCKFIITPELLEDTLFQYEVGLAEDMAEQGMYEAMGELP